jgi:hypothetical protein
LNARSKHEVSTWVAALLLTTPAYAQWHYLPTKTVEALQNATASGKPVLMKVNYAPPRRSWCADRPRVIGAARGRHTGA